MDDGYAFGDSERAARRLELVAAVFAEPTRELLAAAAEHLAPPELALDLGCGPGFSTRLLHETVGAARTVGLDSSAAFVARASTDAPAGVSFVVHDVRSLPFPTGPGDVVLARLLLAHLRDPARTACQWTREVRVGGVLVLDEIEFIESDQPVLARYEELAVAVVGAITSRWTSAEVDALEQDLAALCASTATGEITWGVRQVVVERTA